MRQDLPLGTLLFTVFTSILEVFLLCLAGYILASKGILDKKTQKQLNRLNVSLFTPALLFSKVAFFLSPEKLRELWIIPLFFMVVTAVSMTVPFLLGSIFRLKKSQRAFAMAASMFMNSNSLPIALMQSLVVTMNHALRWTDDDTKNTMLGRALTYLVLYSTLGMILRWSYGVRLLSQADDEGAIRLPVNDEEHEDLIDSSPECDFDETFRHYVNGSGSDSAATPPIKPSIPAIVIEGVSRPPRPQRQQSKFYNSFPNSPNQSRVALPEIETTSNSRVNSDDEMTEDEDNNHDFRSGTLPVHRGPSHGSPQSTLSRIRRFFKPTMRRFYRAWSIFNEFMTVPLWAALLSIIVALVQPLQHALDVHMQPVKGALTSAGNCSIPVTLVVLGAYFYPTPKEEASNSIPAANGRTIGESSSTSTLIHHMREVLQDHQQPPSHTVEIGETKTVIIAVLSRMIITPLLLLPLLAFSAKFDIQQVFEDPVFVLSNVLLVASPPALTLAQITQAASGDAFERLISRTIFWSYCILTPPTTILYVVVGLLFSRL
ncbi:hypothetical protein E1B28_006219 [Marasmius oreades]|uniref:Endoplasmic reticulum auxin efflux carrier n=1 Tax=Marasmius oreades TaxID=181124 RepID=A0A9P7UVL2_9AGAR|nr:uncharacterized protein E1B28_006219 [Marasmius oreades]KAG7095480.1 hypothetical protein E1B28_006219 [Marasmius oreades]